MKKIFFVLIFCITNLMLSGADIIVPEKPANIPEDANWSTRWGGFWKYEYKTNPVKISWYKDGTLHYLMYNTADNSFLIIESYYPNGKLKEIEQSNYIYLTKMFKEKFASTSSFLVGKQLQYHENGNLKEERSYTPIMKKDKKVWCVMCGPEVFYDETGKETKRIEHDVKCEYGYNDIPRKSVDDLIAVIKPLKDKEKNETLVRLPVVGKIASVDSVSKKIEIVYKKGFELNIGDQICCIVDSEIVSFECKENAKGKGAFVLKEDKSKKYSAVTISSEPRFYKKMR
ncbi:MAG TPA: hypothetical protein PLY36_06620 [Spirochaetota bacterium]|nr:hypothetical protein [Spirochaetota bacterium]